MEKEKKYRKLPGRSRTGIFAHTRYRLWLAGDHLLHVSTSAYYYESYKRFYFKDIQALVITRTTKGKRRSIVLGITAGVFFLLALFFYANLHNILASITGMIAAITLIFILINYLLGPTCTCRLNTAVQVETLYSLGRTRSAQKTLSILKQIIETSQGRLTPEDLDAGSEKNEWVQASAHAIRNKRK